MSNPFFDRPILNSPYACPGRHWELDDTGQPTQKVLAARRRAEFITPIPKPKKRTGAPRQAELLFDEGLGLSTDGQRYDHTAIINAVRQEVDRWRLLPDPGAWRVTPETARLLQHWRHHPFSGLRPFFCQIEAVETAIWLTEVAPQIGKAGSRFLTHLESANQEANPGLARLALKLATGAGKTTVMAMLIAWQTINAVRRPGSKKYTRGFLIVAPGLTIKDRLRVLQPNDPDSYYASRELVPGDLLDEVRRAKIVITNYHAFRRRERIEISKGGRLLLQGRGGAALDTLETEGQMLQRVLPDLMGLKQVLAINDEAHHFRNLWEHIRAKMPKKGRGKAESLNPLDLPTQLQTALEALYGHYEKTSVLWAEAKTAAPPCFIVVCNNTSASKLVYDYIAGFDRKNPDGTSQRVPGRLPLFRNDDEHGNPLPRPRTLLIDSEQLESGDALDDNFRAMAADEIERFRREIIERTGDPRQAENLTDQDLLREVMIRAVRPDRDALEIRFPRVAGYRTELPQERLTAEFNADSVLELTPDLVGATETRNAGIIGATVDLNLVHTGDVRPSQIVYELTSYLVLSKWRDANGDPRLNLFGQLKRIARQWLDGYLDCKGGTFPAQLKYKMLADMACERITAGITRAFIGKRPILALLDPYNPVGSTAHVRFNTSKTERWETAADRCHLNWVILDSDWEAEFCRVAENHPRVRAYVKNHNLGLEVPYRYGSEMRKYLPDFICLVEDGQGEDDLLHLGVEIKGYRGEDAKEKKSTMDTYWVPGVNNLGGHGRWAFAEFTDVWQIEADFKAKVESEFNKMIETAAPIPADQAQRRQQADAAMATIEALSGKIDTGGRRFTRDDRNER